MSSYFPTLDSISQPLPKEEFEVLARQYKNEGQYVSVQTRFNYAWGLIKAQDAISQRKGVQILTQLYKDAPDRRREILYYLAIGCYKLGDYTGARRYADVLLDHEPTNAQVNALRQEIEDKLNKEGLFGLAIVSGVVAVGAAVLGAALRRKR